MLQDELKDRTGEIIVKRAALLDCVLALMVRKGALENKKAELLLSGAIDGKNAETREAQIRQMAEAEIIAVSESENLHAMYQSAFDCAVYALDSVKYQIRLIEAMKQ